MKSDSVDFIERLQKLEVSAFEQVVQWHSDDVFRLAYLILGNHDEAEDVLQETFLKLIQRIKSGQFGLHNGSIKSFLLTCARNLCIDRVRQRTIRAKSQKQIQINNDWNLPESPYSVARERDIHTILANALDSLPENQRLIFVLFEFKGDSYKEIADALQIPLSQVKTQLHRARRKLRQRLEKYRGEL